MSTKDRDKISVFGATGFVGSRYCQLSSRECVKIERDSRKPESDDVLYFISTTDNYHVFNDLKIDIETNLMVLMELLEELRDSKGVINFVSSWFVYGETALPATEESYCSPKGFYSITKYAAEELLISFCRTVGVNYRIFRLCNVYGAGDSGVSKKKNALQYLIDEMKSNRDINLYHDGIFYRDYMHVDDVCVAIDLCVNEAPYDCVINIGSGEKILFRDVMEIAKCELDSKSEFIPIHPPGFHKTIQVKDFYMDVSRLKSLGFKQNVSIEDGIRALCQD